VSLFLLNFHTVFFQVTLSFFFHDPPLTFIYPLSLHDALPISDIVSLKTQPSERGEHIQFRTIVCQPRDFRTKRQNLRSQLIEDRSEEHTSELQSRENLVCRLLLEKKKKIVREPITT